MRSENKAMKAHLERHGIKAINGGVFSVCLKKRGA